MQTQQNLSARASEVWDVGVLMLGADLRVGYANDQARELLGARTDAELEQCWEELKPRVITVIDGADSSGEVIVALPHDSARRVLRIQSYGTGDVDHCPHVLILQRVERAWAMDEALRHATQSRGLLSLAGDLSHDLKGLLNVIAMNVEILSRLAQTHDREPRERITVANRCSTAVRGELARLDRSIDVILNRGAADERPVRFDVRTTCRAIADLVASRASRQRVTVTLRLGDEAAEVVGVPGHVYTAVLGLIVNALDAMPRGGTLIVQVVQAGSIRISVSDTGAGIDAQLVPEIWRLPRLRGHVLPGIGLHVVRTVAEAHGGQVSYRSNPGGGACFEVELPRAPALPKPAPAAAKSAPGGNAPHDTKSALGAKSANDA